MTTVEVHRQPGRKLHEVELVLRPAARASIVGLIRHYLARTVIGCEATWPVGMYYMPSMRIVLVLIRENGNVYFRFCEVLS